MLLRFLRGDASPTTLVEALRACTACRHQALILHSHILELGCLPHLFLGNTLVSSYAKWGLLHDADRVFADLPRRDTVSWNALLSGYAKHELRPRAALSLFHQMHAEGFPPDKYTFVSVLNACKTIAGSCSGHGRMIHTLVIACRLDMDVYVGSTLVHMYGACKDGLREASRVFDELPDRNVVTWNAMISAFTIHGGGPEAFRAFERMQRCRIPPNDATFISVLKAAQDLMQTKIIHCCLVESSSSHNAMIDTTLVDTYCKCGSIPDAKYVFKRISEDNTVSWAAMLIGYVDHGCEREALMLFGLMQQRGVTINSTVFVGVLRACCKLDNLHSGYLIHMLIVESNLLDDFICSALINLYVIHSSIDDAYCIFRVFAKPNVASWSSMIEGYAKHGREREAIALFQKMVYEGEKPNSVTFLSVVKACSHMHDMHKCISFHVQMIETGSSAIDFFVGSALIDMYAKCDDFLKALEVFNRLSKRNVMAWNAIISRHVNSGDVWEALRLYADMQAENISPNGITFASIVKACRLVCALEEGKIIHSAIIHHNLESDIFLKSALIDLYAKTGSCEDACKIFDDSARHELVPCNVMMRGYVHHGQYQDALRVFSQMDCNPVSKTDSFMLVSLLQVCSLIGAGMEGKLVHMLILESGFELSLFIGNALIDMYIKCGSVRDALEVLLMLKFRDIVSWSVIIAGFAATGNCAMAFHCFAQMQREGFEPNEVTFLSMFSMCNRMGASTEAPGHMHLMREFYSVKPTMDHYNVIVDALARAGLLKEANDLIRALPFALNLVGWASLLGHCSMHGNIRLAKHSFNHFVTLDNTHATGYMHMAAAICSKEDISGRDVRPIS